MTIRPASFAAAAVIGLTGCGSDASEPGVGSMEAVSESGDLEGLFTLRPDPPAVGLNELEMALKTVDGEGASGASVTVEPWMSVHGHGANETPTVSDRGDGKYRAENVEYTMPGAWELRIRVTLKGVEDQFVLSVEVE